MPSVLRAGSARRRGRDVRRSRLRRRETAILPIRTSASRLRLRTWIARTSPTGTSASSRRILITSTGTAMGSAARLRSCLGAAPSLGFFRRSRAARLARKTRHGLDVDHLEQTVPAQLAADAAVLDSAEGHPRIRFHRAGDEDAARLKPEGTRLRVDAVTPSIRPPEGSTWLV